MAELSIADFWKARLAGAQSPLGSNLEGWLLPETSSSAFVEPSLRVREGDPATAKILIIAAPGAVGKTTLAQRLSQTCQLGLVDLASTTPLGGNFFMGGIANAFGRDALTRSEQGQLGLVIDGLDEAQLRAGPEGFQAGLNDLANLVRPTSALPAVLLGRSGAAEDAWYILTEAGHECCMLDIDFFDDERSFRYLEAKLPHIAAERDAVAAAFATHSQQYLSLAKQMREKLSSIQSEDSERFTGYAPVLDAICSYVLDPEELNPQRRITALEGATQVALVRAIADGVLKREQGKVLAQLRADLAPEVHPLIEGLYSPDEQRARLGSRLFGYDAPSPPNLPTPEMSQRYMSMVDSFLPAHPFVDAAGRPANAVFAADLVVWSLLEPSRATMTRTVTKGRPALLSGVILDLYGDLQGGAPKRVIPLDDVGILQRSLKSQITSGQQASFELLGDEGADVGILSFEVLDRDTAKPRRTYGPFQVSLEGLLELETPLSNAVVHAPIWVSLSGANGLQLEAPVSIDVKSLSIANDLVFVQAGSAECEDAVMITAEEADVANVQQVNVSGASLSVTWPGSKVFPWTSYSSPELRAVDDNIDFLRRRLRRILTAFRSERNSGNLLRAASKIDALRMVKDRRGETLVRCLVEDGILEKFEGEGFYRLDTSRFGQTLGINYQALQQSHFNDATYEYLESVAARISDV